MAYIQQFDKLLEATFALSEKLDDFHNRYDVTANFNNPNNLSTLELWIKRMDIVLSCKTQWIAEQDVFKILKNELVTLSKGDGEKKGTMILIGALLHRYFRMGYKYNLWSSKYKLKSHDTYNLKDAYNFAAFGLFGSSKTCTLFQAIREVLQLNSNTKPEHYEREDFKILDVMTIVSCLTMFKEYMLTKDDVGKTRYSKYEHFNTDPDFISILNEIIELHIGFDKKNKPPIIPQFKAIQFTQSLANSLKTEYLELEKALKDWEKALKKDYPDFSKLVFETIKKHLADKVKSEPIRKTILKFLISERFQEQLPPYLRENLEDECLSLSSSEKEQDPEKVEEEKGKSQYSFILDYESFCNAILLTAFDYSRNVLFGGYALLLQSDTIPIHLRNMLNEAATGDKSKKNSPEILKEAVKMLDGHINANPKLQLDWSFFGGKKGYNQLLLKVNYEEEEPKSEKNEAFVASI